MDPLILVWVFIGCFLIVIMCYYTLLRKCYHDDVKVNVVNGNQYMSLNNTDNV